MANFAQLGIQIDSKQAEDAARDLDDLAAAGARAEQSTKRLTKATQDQEKEIADLLGKIDPTVAALGRLDEQERKLAQFRKQGAIDSDTFNQYSRHLNEQRELLGKVDSAQRLAGLSAGQYSNAIRMLPAQFTDIFTSLAGGQNPFLVMIQQGGQISDSFGGIGNTLELMKEKFLSLFSISSSASSALDGISDSSSESSDSLSGLSEGLNSTSDAAGNARDVMEKVPLASSAMLIGLTAAAAAVAALGVAWYQASQQQEAAEKALISTGRYAATSSDELNSLAQAYDRIDGVTRGKALEALTQIAATGRLTGENFRTATDASLRWSAATGESVDTVADKFASLAEDPTQGILKLNEAEHFLTQTQYNRIKALQEEGRMQDAVTEAVNVYANTSNSRATDVVENLSLISTAWRNIKKDTGEVWDAIVDGVNRAQGPLQRIADKIAGLGRDQKNLATYGIAMLNPLAAIAARYGGNAFSGVSSSVDSTATLGGKEGVISSQETKRLEDANKQWASIVEQTDRQAQIRAGEQKIWDAGLAAGKDELEIQKQVTAYKNKQAEIDAKKNKPKANADNNSAVTLLETAQRQVTANEQLATSGEEVTASGRLVNQINQRLDDTTKAMTASTRAQLVAVRDSLTTSDAEARAAQQKTRDLAANIALTERLASAQKLQADQNEVALMGIGRGSQAAELAQRELNIRRDYLKQVNDLEKAQRNENTALTANELQVEKDMLSAHLQAQLAAERSYQDQRMAMQADWRNGFTASFEDYAAQAANVAGQTKGLFDNAFKGAEDAIVQFVTTGKSSFRDLANSIIADLVRIAAKQAVLQIAGAIAGAFAGGSSGVGSTQLGNNYDWAQQTSGWPKLWTGGYTGDGGKYQPKGIVHAGEVVWSQADVKAAGGPKRANAMRPTAGYANGGGPGLPQSRGIGQMSAPQITFNMNMQDGTITSQQQGGNADDSTRELKQMFEAMINAWWTKNNRPGGAAYNMRMGTA